MIPRDQLEKLQHKCKGQGKENLYHLIGVQGGPPGHQELRKLLARKRDSWSKMADRAAHLDIVEEAWELLQTPSDKAEYDRFLRSPAGPQAPPVSPQQQSWGHEQPAIPSPPYQQQPAQPKPRAGLGINAKLVMAGLALVALSLLMTGTDPWSGVGQPETTVDPAPPEVGPADAPAPASGPPSSDPPRPTGTEPGPTRTPRPEAGPGTVVVTTPPPAPAGPSPADPAPTREAPPAGLDVPSPMSGQAPAATIPTPAAGPAVPARPNPQPVVEPLRVGGDVAQPRKTWNVQPEYPRMARLRRIQGIVILEVTVDRQGNVSNVSVLRSVEGLDEAAVEAVRRWRYEPTIIGGRPVSVVLTDTVRFQLRN